MESHLLQMRGLKHGICRTGHTNQKSHLLQMRGLKLFLHLHLFYQWCRIFYRCVD